MNTLLAILKVTDARRDVILAGGLYHRFPWRHLSPSPPRPHPLLLVRKQLSVPFVQVYVIRWPKVVSGLIVLQNIGTVVTCVTCCYLPSGVDRFI